MMYHSDCRLFTGYKPCKHKRACDGCPHYDRIQSRICILSLEALGAVLRSTVLLAPILRKYPNAHITWVTLPSAKALLEGNPFIDRLITVDSANIALLRHLRFDVLMAVDKSLEAGALAETINADIKYGFGLDRNGVIRPLSDEANYQYDVGLSDQLKFFENKKPETEQITQSMGMTWVRDEYVLSLSEAEKAQVKSKRTQLMKSGSKGVIGYNTGCSLLFPYKKFTIEHATEVVHEWRKAFPDYTVALLGGREDTERQSLIKAAFALDDRVVNTPTNEGLRSGILWMDATDMVLSGCSLGMHISIALKKPTIAWFGVSCLQEVDLYDRGTRIQAEVTCSPCWKKSCNNEPKCYDAVSSKKIIQETLRILEGKST